MDQVYVFKNWTSASRMKNEKDPCLRIDVGVLRSSGKTSIEGYKITVYNSKTDQVVYLFYVDMGIEGTWTLSTDEAIEVLNQIGFPCKFSKDHIEISESARKVLTYLKGLGYTHIYRQTRPAEVLVHRDSDAENWRFLSDICDYCYHDFWFVDMRPCLIDGVLEQGEEKK